MSVDDTLEGNQKDADLLSKVSDPNTLLHNEVLVLLLFGLGLLLFVLFGCLLYVSKAFLVLVVPSALMWMSGIGFARLLHTQFLEHLLSYWSRIKAMLLKGRLRMKLFAVILAYAYAASFLYRNANPAGWFQRNQGPPINEE